MTSAQESAARRTRKKQIGKVTSDKPDKTITVQFQRMVRHPMYEKFLRQRTTVYAHDEKNEAHQGDTVEVMPTRPLSKSKRWRLVRIIARADR